MRKTIWWLLLLLAVLACGSALADQEFALDAISGKLSLADSYIVLTADNLDQHEELLAKIERSKEVLQADFADRGVVLQAWAPEMDACLEVTVTEDDESREIFDISTQTNKVRSAYKASHLKGARYAGQGYSFKSADWKRQTLGGLFLVLKYKRTVGDYIYWGYARRTIRNGHTLTLDYQVYNRGLKTKDQNAVNRVANTVEFTAAAAPGASSGSAAPGSAAGVLRITAGPPTETNSGTFAIEGSCTPESPLIGVAMRMGSSASVRFETASKKNGSFKLPITLPEEGIWLVTLNLLQAGTDTVIAEEVFDITTYNSSFLPVTLNAEIPEELPGDELLISGKTVKGVTVQCIVSNGTTTYDKSVRTNGTGKFKFEVPTSIQADYDFTLVFSKKGFETRRFTYASTRNLTEEDSRKQYRKQAIKPAYATLVKKLDAYIGRVMHYPMYVTGIQQSGDEWIVFGALVKSKKTYKNPIVVQTSEEPDFIVDSQVVMYGTCVGSYQVQSEEGNVSYPSFDLLFWD